MQNADKLEKLTLDELRDLRDRITEKLDEMDAACAADQDDEDDDLELMRSSRDAMEQIASRHGLRVDSLLQCPTIPAIRIPDDSQPFSPIRFRHPYDGRLTCKHKAGVRPDWVNTHLRDGSLQLN